MLASLASPQFLRVNKRLTEEADLGEVEGDLGRGDVLGQCVNFVLEAIPLKGLSKRVRTRSSWAQVCASMFPAEIRARSWNRI